MAISKIVSDSIAANTVSSSLISNGSILAVHVANGAIGAAHHDVSANGTGAIPVPFGTTAQRPAGANGYFRYNTTTSSFEGYSTGAWGAIGISTQPPAFRNRIINGDMRIDQRNAGASLTFNNNTYAVDRFRNYATQSSKGNWP